MNGKRYLLDTNAFIQLLSGNDSVRAIIDDAEFLPFPGHFRPGRETGTQKQRPQQGEQDQQPQGEQSQTNAQEAPGEDNNN